MQFKQFYLACLSHASYYLGSGDEAVVIDPQRDIQQYLDEAKGNGQQIKYIIETHSHADFVSGHIELSGVTGARIVYGKRAKTAFEALKVSDGDELTVGQICLRFFETPGHTPESITVVATDLFDLSMPTKMFTGDTLFIGDVGRPDLIGSRGFTAEQMGGLLYDSLHEKIMLMPDETEVYPAHGAGSLCGKSLSKETWSTLGEQKKFNYALQPMSKGEFVNLVANDQPKVPAYFPKSAERNLSGPVSLAELSKPSKLTADEVAKFDGVVLDVRTAGEFGRGHIPGALNIGLSGKFATWAGTFIDVESLILISAENVGQVEEAFMRLARIGIESVAGYVLMGEFGGTLNSIEQLSPGVAAEHLSAVSKAQFVDVRANGEYNAGHAAGVLNLPLNDLVSGFERLDPSLPTFVICQTGYRSSLASSLLERAGFLSVYNVDGGTSAWLEEGLSSESASV